MYNGFNIFPISVNLSAILLALSIAAGYSCLRAALVLIASVNVLIAFFSTSF
jgi:hypothetical protein